MTLLSAERPGQPVTYFHSFGPEGELRFTQAPDKARRFGSADEAHQMRESPAFWQGLNAGEFSEVAIWIRTL